MQIQMKDQAVNVHFFRERIVIQRKNAADIHTTRTTCKLSVKKDPNGKGKNNYIDLTEKSIIRGKDDQDNKGKARRAVLALTLEDYTTREARKEFWKEYFTVHKHEFKKMPLSVAELLGIPTERKKNGKGRQVKETDIKQAAAT